MATVIDMPLPAFPAKNQQDIDNQIISNVPGHRLLRLGYLDQRVPPWEDQSEILDDERSSDVLIRSHGVAWKVHQHILESSLPVFEEAHRETHVDGEGCVILLNYDDPLALDGLLFWVYSGEPPYFMPLKNYQEWKTITGLWLIAAKYEASGLMDDISAIILSSKPPDWGSDEMLTDLVSIISQFPRKFQLQANLFLRRLLYACRERILAGELDELMSTMPDFLNESKVTLEG